MKNLLFLLVAGLFLMVSSCDTMNTEETLEDDLVLKSAPHMKMNFKAHLSGDEEVSAVETNATGQAIFKLSKDGSMLHYKLIVANIDDVLAAHIHDAPGGVNGGVIVGLYTDGLIEGRTNGALAEGMVEATDELIEKMKEGNTYVNVHTFANRGGEIRGQISGN